MKKRVFVLALVLLLTVVVTGFSQNSGWIDFINFGFWGQATWAPFVYRGDADGEIDGRAEDGPGIGVGSGPAWDDIGAGIGLYAASRKEGYNAGFVLNMWMASGSSLGPVLIGSDSNAYLWARPLSMLYMRFGLFRYEDFRGRVEGITYLPFCGDADTIFQRSESSNFGALIVLTPPPNSPSWLLPLKIFANFGVTGSLNTGSSTYAALTTKGLRYIFASPHAGIGYDLENILFARFQFIGSNYIYGQGIDFYNNASLWFPAYARYNAKMEFAVNVSAINNLKFDAGFGFSMPRRVMKDDLGSIRRLGPTFRDLGDLNNTQRDSQIANNEGDTYQPPHVITLAAGYTWNDWYFLGRMRLLFGERVVFDDAVSRDDFIGGFKLEAGIEPFYDFGPFKLSLPVGINFRANDTLPGNNAVSNNGTVDINIGAWFHQQLNSFFWLTAGINATLPLTGDGYYWTPNGTESQMRDKEAFKNGRLHITVPITFTMSLL